MLLIKSIYKNLLNCLLFNLLITFVNNCFQIPFPLFPLNTAILITSVSLSKALIRRIVQITNCFIALIAKHLTSIIFKYLSVFLFLNQLTRFIYPSNFVSNKLRGNFFLNHLLQGFFRTSGISHLAFFTFSLTFRPFSLTL
jgi:hypothetical protein